MRRPRAGSDRDGSRVPVRVRDRADGPARRAVRWAAERNGTLDRHAGGAAPKAPGEPARPEPEPFISTDGPVLSTRFKDTQGNVVGRVRRGRRLRRSQESAVVHDAGADHRRGLTLKPPRSWRGRVSNREKVVLHPEGQPKAQVSGGQRRRGGAGDLQGSIHPRAGPPCAAGRHDHRGLCDWQPQGLRLHSGRVFPVGPALQSCRGGSVRPRLAGQEHPGERLRSGCGDPSRGRSLYLRRGDSPAHLAGGRKGFPRLKPPFPAISGLFQCPTIVNNVETLACVPFILREGRRAFCGHRYTQAGRHEALLGERACEPARPLRGAGGRDPAGVDRRPRSRSAWWPEAQGCDPRWNLCQGADGRRDRRPHGLRLADGCRHDGRLRPA